MGKILLAAIAASVFAFSANAEEPTVKLPPTGCGPEQNVVNVLTKMFDMQVTPFKYTAIVKESLEPGVVVEYESSFYTWLNPETKIWAIVQSKPIPVEILCVKASGHEFGRVEPDRFRYVDPASMEDS